VLLNCPGVAEAAVIGMQDGMRGEVPVAFVIPAQDQPEPTDLQLRNFCRERLASYKIPRQFILEKELPRGGTGKILKRALKVERP
jgi:acyl-coenzyme A synthetase/AMP-(fatty) acid ligase